MPSQQEKRLDSLALLIQGQSPCGATHFNGKELFLANNAQDLDTIRFIIEQLKDAAKFHYDALTKIRGLKDALKKAEQSLTALSERKSELDGQGKRTSKLRANILTEKETIRTLNNDMDEFYKYTRDRNHKIAKKIVAHAKGASHFRGDTDHEKRFIKATCKVLQSIRYAYLKNNDKHAWSRPLADALRDGDVKFICDPTHSVTYRPQKQGLFEWKTKKVHAELQIIDYLIAKSALDIRSKIYFGISKRCCLNCENAIKAVNYVKKSTIIANPNEDNQIGIVCRDEGSGEPFPAMYPSFLSENKAIRVEFLKLAGHETLHCAFKVRSSRQVKQEEMLHEASSEYERSGSPSRTESSEEHNERYMRHMILRR